MTVERAIELFDVREKQALAFCDIYKEKLDKIFAKNLVFYPVAIILAMLCIALKLYLSEYKVVVLVKYVSVGLLLLLLTKKVQINNGVLNWCGKHLFDIYLVHRIPMDIFYALRINSISNYLYFGLGSNSY